MSRAGDGSLEPGFEEGGGFLFVAGEEVAVAVEGDGDAGVAHVGAEGFGVDAGGDHVGGVAVAAFVQADRVRSAAAQAALARWLVVLGLKGLLPWSFGKTKSLSAGALVEAVVEEVGAEGVGDRDAAVAGAALRFDEAGDAVPGALDLDEVLVEVDWFQVERLEFAHAESGVEGGRPERPLCER